jgi:hypothetical protein
MAIQYVVGICHVLMDVMDFMFMGKSTHIYGSSKGNWFVFRQLWGYQNTMLMGCLGSRFLFVQLSGTNL